MLIFVCFDSMIMRHLCLRNLWSWILGTKCLPFFMFRASPPVKAFCFCPGSVLALHFEEHLIKMLKLIGWFYYPWHVCLYSKLFFVPCIVDRCLYFVLPSWFWIYPLLTHSTTNIHTFFVIDLSACPLPFSRNPIGPTCVSTCEFYFF